MKEKKDILNDSEEALEKSESAEEKAEALVSEDAEAFSENQEDKTEYEPKNKYERALYRVYKDENLFEMMKISSYAIVALTVYAFFMRIVDLISENLIGVVDLLLITGVPFVTVSIMRCVFNAPRPYELLEFYEKKPKAKLGKSFPSRHVFSVFVIATALLPSNLFLGIALLALGAALAVMRVLMGMHFIRDVAAGALMGIISAALGLIIVYFV